MAEAAAEDPLVFAHPPEVRYRGFACEGYTIAETMPRWSHRSRRRSSAKVARRLRWSPRPRRPTPAFSPPGGIPAVCFGPYAEQAHGVGRTRVLPLGGADRPGPGIVRPRLVRALRLMPTSRRSLIAAAVGLGAVLAAGAAPAAGGAWRGRPAPTALHVGKEATFGEDRRAPLRGVPEIRRFFRTNETPVYFVSATAFNLLGIDRWVRDLPLRQLLRLVRRAPPARLRPARIASRRRSTRSRRSATTCSAHKEVVDCVEAAGGGKAVFLMFDEETERLAERGRARGRVPAGGAAAPARLEDRDDPARRTRPACRASRTCSAARRPTTSCSRSPRAPGSARTSSCRRRTATPARRRSSSRPPADWDEHAEELVDEDLKVMKRIDCRGGGDRGRRSRGTARSSGR